MPAPTRSSGDDLLVGDGGADQLSGQHGLDVFGYADVLAPPAGGGSDQLLDFTNGEDKLSVIGASAIHSLSDLTFSISGGDVLITTAVSGEVIRLIGFAVGNIDASDFIFAPAAEPVRGEHLVAAHAATELTALP